MQLVEKIVQVYEEYALVNDDKDIAELANIIPIKRKVEAFNLYKEYLKGNSRFLDWGCKDGHDGFMIKSHLEEPVEIHGCDIRKGKYSIFIEKTNLNYTQLNHYYKLPYEDNYFDVVIGNGVLEHAANDSESLKELYRILKPGGYLIITFLPNKLSYTEFISRLIKYGAHRRIYSLKEIKRILLRKGFLPVEWGYHQVVPSLVSKSKIEKIRFLYPIINILFQANKYLDKMPLINKFAANIYVISQKRSWM